MRKYRDYEMKPEYDHVMIYRNGEFVFSADTELEAMSIIDIICQSCCLV